MFDQAYPTICYNVREDRTQKNLIHKKLEADGFWQQLFADLKQRNVQSVLIEGGPQLFQQLMALGLWDEARVFIAPHSFGSGLAAPRTQGVLVGQEMLQDNRLEWWVRVAGT